MQTYIYYRISLENEQELSFAREHFERFGWNVQAYDLNVFVTTEESKRVSDKIGDDGTYLNAILEDVKPLIDSFKRDIDIEATVDASDVSGEMMDYIVSLKNGKLKIKQSDWYIEANTVDFIDYEDFCESFYECSEDEYDAVKDGEYVYLIETDDGDILTNNVPLYEVSI